MRPLLTLLILDAPYQRLTYRFAFWLFAAVVALGSIPGARADIGELASGVVLHSLTYSVIAALLFYGRDASPPRKAIEAFLIVALMGAFDEFVQSFFPYRSARVGDWLVDMNAAMLTVVVLWRLWSRSVPRV